MRIVVIDGQGGRMGRAVIDALRAAGIAAEITAVGTNSAATSCMMGGRPDACATGENAVVVGARDADFIVGPIGIVIADSLHGEISPTMATAVGQSRAHKILLPVSRCQTTVVGVRESSFGDLVAQVPGMITGMHNEKPAALA